MQFCHIILYLSLLMVSCFPKEEQVNEPAVDTVKIELEDIPIDQSAIVERELIREEPQLRPSLEELTIEQPEETMSDDNDHEIEITEEQLVSIYEKIDADNIHHATLIALIEEGINQIRIKSGLSVLMNRRNLKDAAAIQNDYCIKISGLTHNHDNAKYATVRDRVVNYGGRYNAIGENIQYYGFLNNEINGEVFLFPPDYQEAAKDIVTNWVDSPGHYENIINGDFKSFGTALGWNDQLHAIFVTQVYGG